MPTFLLIIALVQSGVPLLIIPMSTFDACEVNRVLIQKYLNEGSTVGCYDLSTQNYRYLKP
jgi:hypothetical protein